MTRSVLSFTKIMAYCKEYASGVKIEGPGKELQQYELQWEMREGAEVGVTPRVLADR